jgi:hypothetical protein
MKRILVLVALAALSIGYANAANACDPPDQGKDRPA